VKHFNIEEAHAPHSFTTRPYQDKVLVMESNRYRYDFNKKKLIESEIILLVTKSLNIIALSVNLNENILKQTGYCQSGINIKYTNILTKCWGKIKPILHIVLSVVPVRMLSTLYNSYLYIM